MILLYLASRERAAGERGGAPHLANWRGHPSAGWGHPRAFAYPFLSLFPPCFLPIPPHSAALAPRTLEAGGLVAGAMNEHRGDPERGPASPAVPAAPGHDRSCGLASWAVCCSLCKYLREVTEPGVCRQQVHVSLNPSCGPWSDHFFFFFFLLILIISCSLFSLGPSSCSFALTMHKEQAAVGAGSCLPCGLLPTPLKQQNLQDSGWGAGPC